MSGQHWFDVALERIRAGEPEKKVMEDYGFQWCPSINKDYIASPTGNAWVYQLIVDDDFADDVAGYVHDSPGMETFRHRIRDRRSAILDYRQAILKKLRKWAEEKRARDAQRRKPPDGPMEHF